MAKFQAQEVQLPMTKKEPNKIKKKPQTKIEGKLNLSSQQNLRGEGLWLKGEEKLASFSRYIIIVVVSSSIIALIVIIALKIG